MRRIALAIGTTLALLAAAPGAQAAEIPPPQVPLVDTLHCSFPLAQVATVPAIALLASAGQWDLIGQATCAFQDPGEPGENSVFTAQVAVPISSTFQFSACGTGILRGHLTVSNPQIIAGADPAAWLPVDADVQGQGAGFDFSLSGSNARNQSGESAGTLSWDMSWFFEHGATCPDDHFKAQGSFDVTWVDA